MAAWFSLCVMAVGDCKCDADCQLFVYNRCGVLMSRAFQQRPLQRVLVFQPGLHDPLKCETC